MVQSPTPPNPPAPVRRTSARLRLGIPARLQLFDGNRSCRLDDLSRCGAKTSLVDPPTVGRSGILTCEELDVFCLVVWSKPGQCGLHFDELLPQELLLKMRNLIDNYAQHERDRVTGIARDWVTGSNRIL